MTLDWQIILVALTIITAGIYVSRRVLRRVKSLTSKSGDGSCATGCGSCGDNPSTNKESTVIQITRQPVAATSRFVKRR